MGKKLLHGAWEDTEAFRAKWLWFWGVEVVGASALAGLTAMILWDRSQLQGWQVFLITFGVFVGGLALVYIVIFSWCLFRRLQPRLSGFISLLLRRSEAAELLDIKDRQRAEPSKWLYPVIEIIDLNTQGYPINDISVRFQIDSHLLFLVSEFYVFAKLCLAPDDIHSKESEWYEIKKPENYAPIECLMRYGFSDSKVHLLGKTDREQCLLKWIQEFRDGKPLLAMLKIGIKFKKDDKPIYEDLNVLEGNGPRYIEPMNNYRMAKK